jgi:urea transport system substrate-binding protein
LVEANLRGANLSGANLEDADLSGAYLVEANLKDTNLTHAKLLGINLRAANLGGAILSGTDMSGANLSGADLTRVDLTEVRLRGVILTNARLIGANFEKTNLSGVRFTSANLNGANFSNANLSGASLSQANMSGAILKNADISGAWLNLTNLIGADLSGADLNGASLIGADLASVNFFGGQLVGAILIGANLNGANLSSANLTSAQLKESNLRRSSLLADPVLLELNKAQLGQVIKDAAFLGLQSDSRTQWPDEVKAEIEEAKQKSAQAITEAGASSIKVGLLHSFSGPRAIYEEPIYEGEMLAINEINAAGGIFGLKVIPVIEDGTSDWQFFAEKALQLLVEDEVAVIFGCWANACRQAVRPIVEQLDGLLFYPAYYEGLETSPNIFYTGADASQQIIPALEYLLAQGHNKFFFLGNDSKYSHDINDITKQFLLSNKSIKIEYKYVRIDHEKWSDTISGIKSKKTDAIISTLIGDSNQNFFKEFSRAGLTAEEIPVMNIGLDEEEVKRIGVDNLVCHLTSWNYLQSIESKENDRFVTTFKATYGTERVTTDQIHAGYVSVHLWKALVEKANFSTVDQVKKAAADREEPVQLLTPGGLIALDAENQHTYKIMRIGIVGEDGLIEEVWSSKEPIKPDPLLLGYDWAVGLSSLK